MEQVIRDERNKLVDFLDNAPIGFYSVDGDGPLPASSTRPWPTGSARSPAELVERRRAAHDFLAGPAAAGRAAHATRSTAAPRTRSAARWCCKGRDGRVIHAWIGQSVVADGDELRTRSVVRDLTPEREWEEALRLSRQRFQRFFANAPVGIALLDRVGRLEEANRALANCSAPPRRI